MYYVFAWIRRGEVQLRSTVKIRPLGCCHQDNKHDGGGHHCGQHGTPEVKGLPWSDLLSLTGEPAASRWPSLWLMFGWLLFFFSLSVSLTISREWHCWDKDRTYSYAWGFLWNSSSAACQTTAPGPRPYRWLFTTHHMFVPVNILKTTLFHLNSLNTKVFITLKP